MLPLLEAEQQLRAIEAATVPHLKPDGAKRIVDRLVARLRPREHRATTLHGALMQAGVRVVEVEAKKRPRKRRDTSGHEKR